MRKDQHVLHIYMKLELWDKLNRYCFEKKTFKSALVAKIVKEFLENEEKKKK